MRDGVKRADDNAELQRSFEKDVLPLIGDKPVRVVDEGDIRAVLRSVIGRGTYRMASRIYADMVQLFAWAEARKPWRALMVDGNPIKLVELAKLLPHGCDPDAERDRVLSADELRELQAKLAAMEAAYAAAPAGAKYDVDRPLKKETQLALWICLGTLCRIGDRQMQFKNRAGPLKNRKHDNSLTLSGGRAGAWTPHDLRRTGATMMQQLGVSLDLIDRCQNHVMAGSRVRRAYLHHDYAAEKQEAWGRLGERLDVLLDSSAGIPKAGDV